MTGIARTGCVYIARNGNFAKIGYASSPQKRVREINSGGLIYPDGYDFTVEPHLVLVVPFCRRRDERNMQLLFGSHWITGEWFRWSPAFVEQMQGMHFVTHAVRRKHLADWRRLYGGDSHAKEELWGMPTQELLAHLAARRMSHTPNAQRAA